MEYFNGNCNMMNAEAISNEMEMKYAGHNGKKMRVGNKFLIWTTAGFFGLYLVNKDFRVAVKNIMTVIIIAIIGIVQQVYKANDVEEQTQMQAEVSKPKFKFQQIFVREEKEEEDKPKKGEIRYVSVDGKIIKLRVPKGVVIKRRGE